jgi:hypothetical protein
VEEYFLEVGEEEEVEGEEMLVVDITTPVQAEVVVIIIVEVAVIIVMVVVAVINRCRQDLRHHLAVDMGIDKINARFVFVFLFVRLFASEFVYLTDLQFRLMK